MPLAETVSNTADSSTVKKLRKAWKNIKTLSRECCSKEYISLNTLSYLMAQTLLLNHYEVNRILRSFLVIWTSHPTSDTIPCTQIQYLFPQKFSKLIGSFFNNIKDIGYNVFFLFICLFTFFETELIFPVLLSISKIHSNLFITSSQVLNFFSCFNLDNNDYPDIYDKMKVDIPQDSSTDRYYLKDFQSYFISKDNFHHFLSELRTSIIQHVISDEVYQIIKKKIIFYYSCSIYDPPKESCIDSITRLLFTELPPPYKYDFKLISLNKKSFNDMIYAIRYSYGYSDRRSSGSCMWKRRVKHSNISISSSMKQGSVRLSKAMEENSSEVHSHRSFFKNRINPINDSDLPSN